MKINILIVDDDPFVRESLSERLFIEGYGTMSANDADEAIAAISSTTPDIAILDVNLPGISGIDLLEKIKAISPEISVVILTGYGSVQDAVDAMKKGADDYLLKPCSIDELNIVLNQIIKQRNLKNENIELKRQLEKYRGVSAAGMIGRSSAMRQVYERIEAVAKSESTVLIIGETGTGKDLVAHDIHKQSSRKDRPFVKLDCAALPETLLESELFGHEKGAFTGASKSLTGRFEQANGGLLFLDEIGNMSLATQAKLLNVIQDREFTRIGGDHKISVDIRLLCATNTDLERAVAKGEFREDLYYRLNVVPIRVPPLRERRDDIPILASHFLNRFQTSNNRGPMTISRDALDLLYSFNWPGNVRELENVVERLVILSKGNEITVSNLPSRILNIEKKNVPFSPHIEMKSDETLREAVESFEAQLIHDTLDEMNGSRDKTASKLGISRITLYNKMKRYGFLDSD